MDWVNATAIPEKKQLSFEIWCALYKRFDGTLKPALNHVFVTRSYGKSLADKLGLRQAYLPVCYFDKAF